MDASDEKAVTGIPAGEVKSRRAFLFKLSLVLNGAVGAVLAVPVLGYLLGPAFRKGSSYNSWISLGAIGEFPEGQTRLVDYRNPVTTPWDGRAVSDLRHQLCASRLPRAMVRAIEAFPVPMPRRRLLRGRIPRIGTAAARPV
jgi:hypothetical protein